MLDYTIIAWDITCKEVEKATNYAYVIGDYDNMWGGHTLLYHRDNTRTVHLEYQSIKCGLS